MNLRDLLLRIRALVRPNRVEGEFDEELAFHIERDTEKHIAAGLSPTDARTRAIARFGPVPLAADECHDARGTGVVDDLRRDIRYAFRTFRRAPLAAVTILATVALGVGHVAVVFTVYNMFFLRVDAVRSSDELFAYVLQIGFWLTVVLGGLALALTVSGLFSVLSYVVEQQAKEIGVRMALGATTRNVTGLVRSQSIHNRSARLASVSPPAAAWRRRWRSSS